MAPETGSMSSHAARRPAARHEPLGVQSTADHDRSDDDAPERGRMEEIGDSGDCGDCGECG